MHGRHPGQPDDGAGGDDRFPGAGLLAGLTEPDNITPVPVTARTDLAVLAFWALYHELKARHFQTKANPARTNEAGSQLFRQLTERLQQVNGIAPAEWKKPG